MRNFVFTNQFRKDLQELKTVINLLTERKQLGGNYKDHKLVGNFIGRRECHIESDWLLIYKLDGDTIIFERIGTHSDLFE